MAEANAEFRDELLEMAPSLRAFARTFVRDPAHADDLVQDTLVKAWTNSDKFKAGTNMQAWLFTILRNTFYSQVRKRKREVEDGDGAYAASLAEKPSHDQKIIFTEFRDALAELPDDQREALILVGASGLSYEEAAEICDCAVGTIKSRVNRARKRLLVMLGEADAASLTSDPMMDAAIDGGTARLTV